MGQIHVVVAMLGCCDGDYTSQVHVNVIGKMLRCRADFLVASGRRAMRRQFPCCSWYVQDVETQNAKRAEATVMMMMKMMITNSGSFAPSSSLHD